MLNQLIIHLFAVIAFESIEIYPWPVRSTTGQEKRETATDNRKCSVPSSNSHLPSRLTFAAQTAVLVISPPVNRI